VARGAAGVGYLLKDRVGDVDEFIDVLARMAAGGIALDPEVVTQLLGASGLVISCRAVRSAFLPCRQVCQVGGARLRCRYELSCDAWRREAGADAAVLRHRA
jgi:hypothetical protein